MFNKKLSIIILMFLLFSCGRNNSSDQQSDLNSTLDSQTTSQSVSDSSSITSETAMSTSEIGEQSANTSVTTATSIGESATSEIVTSYQSFTVNFVTNSSNQLDPINTSLINFPPSISNDPLVLEGWYLDAEFTQVVTFPFRVLGPTTLYAKWIEGTTGFNFQINHDSTGYIVESYAGNASQVVIPVSHQGLPVLELGAYLFYENASLTSISISSSVKTIAYAAFKKTSNLIEVTIPNSVTTIANDAFSGASKLSSVTFSNTLKMIGANAFEKTALTSATLPSSLEEIGARAFAEASLLNTVNLLALTPPLRYPTSFENTGNSLKYYVPSVALATYKSHASWSAYSSQIYTI